MNLIEKALSLHKSGNLKDAREIYLEILKNNSADDKVHYYLGVNYAQTNEHENAIKHFLNAIEINPKVAIYHYNRGVSEQKLGKLDLALISYNKSLELNPLHIESHNNKGLVQKELRQLEEALNTFTIAVGLNSHDASLLLNRALAHHALGHEKEALADYEKAIEIDPQNHKAYNNLGLLQEQAGEYDLAMRNYLKSVSIEDRYINPKFNLGNLAAKFENNEMAISYFNQILSLTSKKILSRSDEDIRKNSIEQLVRLYYKLDRWDQIERILKEQAHEIWRDDDFEYNELYVSALKITKTSPSPFKRRNRFQFLVNKFKDVCSLEGMVAECGCLKGLSSFLLCHTIRSFYSNFKGDGYQIFDSFEGLSEPGTKDFFIESDDVRSEERPSDSNIVAGQYAASEDHVRQSLADFPNVELFRGWIPNAFPHPSEVRYKFVHIDVDLYQPTLDSLEYFWPLMVRGGIVLCDDFNWPGAEAAVKEFSGKHNLKFFISKFNQAYFIK